MLDNPQKWQPVPDWSTTELHGDSVCVRTLQGLTQCLVSGDLRAFTSKHGLDLGIGALGVAHGSRYTARMARDRITAIGLTPDEMGMGWSHDGYGVTQMSAALHVFEFTGARILDVVARATTLNPDDAGHCAAVQFASVTGCLYFHESKERMRLHIDRGLAPYVWSWLQKQAIFGGQ